MSAGKRAEYTGESIFDDIGETPQRQRFEAVGGGFWTGLLYSAAFAMLCAAIGIWAGTP